MPHLVILYTGNLAAVTDLKALCRALADAMLSVTDEVGQPAIPTGGTRLLALPAPHFAVADGGADGRATGFSAAADFVHLHLRRDRGRSAAVHLQAGQKLYAVPRAHLAPLLARRPVGVTLQIDEGSEAFDARNSSLHPLFALTAAATCGVSGRRGGGMGEWFGYRGPLSPTCGACCSVPAVASTHAAHARVALCREPAPGSAWRRFVPAQETAGGSVAWRAVAAHWGFWRASWWSFR